MMTTVGDKYFLDKDKFAIKIGDSPMQQAIKFFETKMVSCCGVKKNVFVGDREISFNVSSRYDALFDLIKWCYERGLNSKNNKLEYIESNE